MIILQVGWAVCCVCLFGGKGFCARHTVPFQLGCMASLHRAILDESLCREGCRVMDEGYPQVTSYSLQVGVAWSDDVVGCVSALAGTIPEAWIFAEGKTC